MTTKNQAHSPLPWTVGEHPKDKSGTEWREILYPSEFGPAYIGQALESDAQLIVKAVNCHEELLEALKNLELLARKKLDQSATQDGLQVCEALAMARKAISKAQGDV